MNPSGGRAPIARHFGPTVPLLGVAAVALALLSRLPIPWALLLALLGVGAGVGLRATRYSLLREVSVLPVLVALGGLALTAPLLAVPELLVGAAGVVFVAWLADDPARPRGGARRGAIVWAIPGLGVGVAWASAFLLPSTAAPLGVAGGLLAASLIALAYLVARPELFDRDGQQRFSGPAGEDVGAANGRARVPSKGPS
jgi:hypothetical protein